MASIYFIPINSHQNVAPIYNCVYTIIFGTIDLTKKLSDFINLSKYNVPLGVRHCTTNAAWPWRHSTLTVQLMKTISACQQLQLHSIMTSHANCNCKRSVSKCLYLHDTSVRIEN